MPFDGNGEFTPSEPSYPAVAGALITAEDFNTIIADIAANGLSMAVTRDGQSPMLADLPMGQFALTNLGQGSASQPSVRWGAGNGWYQIDATTWGFAIGSALAFTISPTELTINGESVLTSGTVPTLTGVNTFNGAQKQVGVDLTDAATVAIDSSLGNSFRLLIGGNRTLGNPTNLTEDQSFDIKIVQGGAGGNTLAYAGLYRFPGGTPPVLSTAAGAVDVLSCKFWSDAIYIDAVLNKNFS